MRDAEQFVYVFTFFFVKEERKRELTWVRVKVYRCKKNKEKNRKKKEEIVEADQRVSLQNSELCTEKMCIYSSEDPACERGFSKCVG